jgi:type IV fimbrial biogenesis protein FimT
MELMIVLAIAALVLAVGAPNFQEFRRNNRLTGVANDFLGAMQTARAEAIKRQVSVSVCPSADPTDPAATCSSGNFTGWIVFADTNGGAADCLRNGADVLLRSGGPIETQVNARSGGGVCVSFAPTGFRQDIAGRQTAPRTVFCDTRGKSQQQGMAGISAAREVQVTPTGRSHITRVINELNDGAIGAVVACP